MTLFVYCIINKWICNDKISILKKFEYLLWLQKFYNLKNSLLQKQCKAVDPSPGLRMAGCPLLQNFYYILYFYFYLRFQFPSSCRFWYNQYLDSLSHSNPNIKFDNYDHNTIVYMIIFGAFSPYERNYLIITCF